MEKSSLDKNRIGDKTRLLLKFNYVSSLLSLILGFISLYALQIEGIITFTFFVYFGLNLLNVAAFKIHRNLTAMAIYTSVLSVISTLAITLFSGGIESPFIFILAIIVLAGYVSTRLFGRIYLYAMMVLVILIFAVGQMNLDFITNEIPPSSSDIFSLVSILFAIYLLGGVFGKDLLKAHHNLYRSKAEIESRIVEKETLLKEVHHRVKNNLQSVSSLLSLQAKNSPNEELKTLIKSSQNRIISMSIIHEMLYARDNLSKIDFRPYVHELTEYLVRSILDKEKKVDIDINIPEVSLSIDTAIPLGLLINEVITNSLKYGFTEQKSGKIQIHMKAGAEAQSYKLTISDNGVGFSEQMESTTSNSLGVKLIHNLSRQLHGSAKRLDAAKGTTYHIYFKDFSRQLENTAP